ncbi:MAG: universal stress protein [Parabacteroides sp.]
MLGITDKSFKWIDMKEQSHYFLDLIKRSRRGKFKIYIGMIAGVGKTYRMLQDAHEMIRCGVDVQIGYVETHGRPDTVKALKGLPLIPRKKIFYKGKEMEEMDLDAILQIHPEIVIVDELAHTNVEGCRHAKRWQDVMELLDAGINVLSAVNIQHIESLNDEVQGIVGIRVKERIPDSVLQDADEVVNIDLTAEELINRLKAGKIYTKDKIQMALDHFFKNEHILQLRELALKEVAFRVGKKVANEVRQIDNRGVGLSRVLVCVSSNSETQQHIIRKASRLAEILDSELVALYVQTSKEQTDRIPLDVQRHLMGHLELVVQLGGRIRQMVSDNIPQTIATVCQEENISLVCMGQPSLSWPRLLRQGSNYRKLLLALKTMSIDLVIFASV